MKTDVITNLEDAINQEALALIQEENVPVSDRLDRFKAVSTYYIGMRKIRGGSTPQADENSFDSIVSKISKANNEG